MGGKLTNEDFLKRLKELGRDDLIPLEEYKGRHINMKFKCLNPDCGFEWEAQPGNIYVGQGCPACARREGASRQRYTTEEFMEKLKEKGRNDIELIGEYINSATPALFRCTNEDCKHEWHTAPGNILYSGYTCPVCNYRKSGQRNSVSQEEFEQKVKELNSDIASVGEYVDRNTETDFTCVNGHTWKETPISFYESPYCPVCNPRGVKLISGVNDLATLRPDLVKYFKDKTLPSRLKVRSNQKVELVCPDCGHKKEMFVYNLYNQGFHCNICDDGVSLPNKILRNLILDDSVISQLEEYKIEWRPDDWDKKVFFDTMIKVNGAIVCIEMQGKQHYDLLWDSKKDDSILERDEYKRIECKKRGFIEIEIDCRGENFESIKEEILKSSLGNFIDLSKVDWNKIFNNSIKSIVIEACDMYNNSLMTTEEIGKELHLGRGAIRRYLKIGQEKGFCIYSKEDSEFRRLFNKCKYVYTVYKDDKILTEQINIKNLVAFFEENYPELKVYGNLLNERAKRGYEVDGFKITRREKTQEDIDKYLKIYQ